MTKIFMENSPKGAGKSRTMIRETTGVCKETTRPVLILEQLDNEMKVAARFKIREIPASGISVSRPNATRGSIKLNAAVENAFSVSEEHIRICRNAEGFSLCERPGGSQNGVYMTDGTKVSEAAVHNGMIVWLGDQPVRFVFPTADLSHPTRIDMGSGKSCTRIYTKEDKHDENR